MQYLQCQCGKMQTCGDVAECRGCGACGTNCYKEPSTPHEWEKRYHEKTGKPYEMCKQCMALRGYDEARKP